MNRLEAMSTLLAAIDAGSLSAASRKLGVPLATVSRRVSDLEAVLRTKLLVRTSRRLELTTAGRSYVVGAVTSLPLWIRRSARQRASTRHRGERSSPPRQSCSAGCTCFQLSSNFSGLSGYRRPPHAD